VRWFLKRNSLFFGVKAKSSDDLKTCLFQVHGVEMNVSAACVDEFLTLLDSKINAVFSDFCVVTFDFFKGVCDERWSDCLTEFNHPIK